MWVTRRREKEEEREGKKRPQGCGEKHTASHEVGTLLNLEYRQSHRQRHSVTSNLPAGTMSLDLRIHRIAFGMRCNPNFVLVP
jgi:hypothetical protein